MFTARFMGRNNDNIKLAYKEGYNNNLKQLKKWNLKFHKLLMGKPSFDILIDDRALGFKRNDIQKLKKFLK